MSSTVLSQWAVPPRAQRAILFAALIVVVSAIAVQATGGVAHFNKKRAAELLQSSDAKSRSTVYRASRDLGDSGKSLYRGLLDTALTFHQKKIVRSIALASDEANLFSGTLARLKKQRAFAIEYTLADVEGDSSAMRQLRSAHGDASLWLKEATAQHARAVASMGAINQSSAAIDEIRRELAYCDGKAATISQRTFKRVLSKYSTAASNLHDRLGELTAFHNTVQRFQEAMNHNRAQTWASTKMRAFADQLNDRRNVLGMTPLRLEKRLTAACDKHAEEMAKLKYFAHKSPVSQNATPEKRAANAKYPGTFVGENLFFYATSRDSRAAFASWWSSDAHRFVMFDPKSDEIGLSNKTGTHWTMMTGLAPVRKQVKSARAE